MIQQVLDRSFLQDFLGSMQSEVENILKGPRRRAVTKTPLDDLSGSEMLELTRDIRQARADVTPPGKLQRRRGAARSSDPSQSVTEEKAYIPRSPAVSNLQSAIEEYFRTQRSDT